MAPSVKFLFSPPEYGEINIIVLPEKPVLPYLRPQFKLVVYLSFMHKAKFSSLVVLSFVALVPLFFAHCSGCNDGKHSECKGQMKCEEVDGEGPDKCQNNDGCIAYHNICNFGQCVTVSGPGPDDCGSHADCGPEFKHTSCESDSSDPTVRICTIVDGVGENECQGNNDCQEPLTQICSNNRCVETHSDIAEAQCSSVYQCLDQHFECVGEGECRKVPGRGPNTCQSDSSCLMMRNVLVGDVCVTMQTNQPSNCERDLPSPTPTPLELDQP